MGKTHYLIDTHKLNRHFETAASLPPRELLAYLRPRVADTCRGIRTRELRALQKTFPNVPRAGGAESLWLRTATATAYRSYAPKPYAGHLTLFLASRRAPGHSITPQLGWREHATGSLDVRQVSGDHLSLLSGEESRELAAKLNSCLGRQPVRASTGSR